MKRPPYAPRESVFAPGMTRHILVIGLYMGAYPWGSGYGGGIEYRDLADNGLHGPDHLTNGTRTCHLFGATFAVQHRVVFEIAPARVRSVDTGAAGDGCIPALLPANFPKLCPCR